MSSKKQLSRRSFFGNSAAAGAAAVVCFNPLRWLTHRIAEPTEDTQPQPDELLELIPFDEDSQQLAEKRSAWLPDLANQLEEILWGNTTVTNTTCTVAADMVEVQPGTRYGPWNASPAISEPKVADYHNVIEWDYAT